MDNATAVGMRIRAARQAAGLLQRDLAFDGCTSAYVSRIEVGARIPSLQILREFAKRLGVSAEYLATGEVESGGPSSEFLEAEIAIRLGEEDRAAELYEAARKNAESGTALAQARLGLGRLAVRRGDPLQAIELLEQALDSGDLNPSDASAGASALGRSYASQGRFDEAIALFRQFLTGAREIGDPFDEVRFAVLLANAYIDQGEFGRAQETLAEVLDLARKTIDPMLRASLYWSQSRVYLSQAQPDRAAEYAQLTVATLRASEQTLEAAHALLLLALIENDRGNPDDALRFVEEGEPAVIEAGETTEAAMFTLERARALAALGAGDEAAGLLLGIAPQLNGASPVSAARAYAAAAAVFRRQGNAEKALELYELAVEISPVENRHVADALAAIAEIYEERGEVQKALDVLKRAVGTRRGVRPA